MSQPNKNSHPFDRKFGNTHMENVCLFIALIIVDVFVFTREYLHSGAGWTYMFVVLCCGAMMSKEYIKMFFTTARDQQKNFSLRLKKFLISLGECAMREPPIYRYIIVSTGAALCSIFFCVAVNNMYNDIYIWLPWIAGSLFFVIFTFLPLLGMYVYEKKK